MIFGAVVLAVIYCGIDLNEFARPKTKKGLTNLSMPFK